MTDTTFDRDVLGSEAAKLLEALLEHVGDEGQGQVSTATLVKASGLTQGGLVRARTELTQHGLLRTEPGFSANGLRGANVYLVNLAALGLASPQVSEGESDQNRTEISDADPSPAQSAVRTASSEQNQVRPGLFSRLFRRNRAA